MIKNIMEAMRVGEVEIQYTSLLSGNEKRTVGTLKGFDIKQSSNSERVVFWDSINKKYEDIKIDTIVNWRQL
jgi:hypothetical protein|tara:strand:+ start:2576 stop:2791 length:216 start_codon:yes stop_codon:yes gene_type:complete